ncbi:MAG: hypothetical protein L3J35_11390 [Bacteroidales bacterium]|nr:hypothetical protein [Bacteroidales bacterium]
MKQTVLIFTFFVFFFAACNDATESTNDTNAVDSSDIALLERAQGIFSVLPEVFENPENEITDAKVKLGKILYFDTRLSLEGNQSCNTCHDLSTYGVDNLPTSPGDNGGLGTRNSPTVFNAAIHRTQFWDGRAKDVEEQAGMPVTNPVEMAMPDEASVIKRLSEVEEYKTMFAEAFPEEEGALNYDNLKKAIGAFERTLMTTDRFDKFLTGDLSALSEQEKKGLNTFMTKGCTACHSGPALGGDLLMKFGIHKDYTEVMDSIVVDEGRFAETKLDKDKFVFKSQSLILLYEVKKMLEIMKKSC